MLLSCSQSLSLSLSAFKNRNEEVQLTAVLETLVIKGETLIACPCALTTSPDVDAPRDETSARLRDLGWEESETVSKKIHLT